MSYDPVGYYETVSAMQRRLHSSEKKRLELEKKLFAYSKSDHRISRLKVAKIQGYLGEVCERERAARHRNQRLLRDFDQIGARVAALSGRADTLRRTKMEYENQVEKLFPSWKEQLGKERQEVLQSAGTKQDGHLYDGNYSTQSFSGLRYPAGALMAHYGLGNRAVNIGLSVPTYQGQTLPGMSVGLGHRLPGTPSIPNVSQKLSVLDDCSFLRGGAVHIEASFGPNDPKRYEMPRECQERSLSQLSNVSGTRQVNMSQGSNGYAIQTAMKAATGPALQDLESHLLETDCDLSEQGASGIQKGSHERCNEGQPIQVEFLTSVKNIDALRNGHFNQPSEMDSSSEAQQHVTDQLDSRPGQTATPSPARASSIEAESEMTVSNLFHLLHTIEQALEDGEQAGSSELYRSTAVHPADMAWVVSFANGEGDSAEKGQPALSILGAVVLQQLQRLSQETTSGCLLPEELLTADLTAITADILRTYLDVDSGRLWDRWHNHARCLIHHGALSISEIATLFGPLLVCETSDHLPQAVEFLKILLKGEGAIAPDRSLSQAASDDSRSVSKSDRLSQAQLDKTLESQAYQQMRERILKQDTLDENASSLDLKDSGEEKLSLNEGTQAESDDDDDDDIEALLSPGRQESVHSRHLAGAVQLSPGASGSRRSPVESCDGRSNTASLEPLTDNAQHSPPNGAACTTFPLGSRESQSTAASGFNKKAFWGDSDDSISDADAILSPRGQEARADDFDDFYD